MITATPVVTCRTIDSPIGALTLAGVGPTLTRLVIAGQRRAPDHSGWQTDDHAFADAVAQLDVYFDGTSTRFDLDVRAVGSKFQRRVWAAVASIPFGQTRSYAQVAAAIGAPSAARAVGVAVGRNPVPIIVACHRVVGSVGSLTGYVGGIDCKQALLAHESGVSARRHPR